MDFPTPTAAPGARRALAGVALALAAASAAADPAAYVFTPYAATGRWDLAYALGTEHDRDGSHATQQTLGLGGSPVSRWYTSAYAAWVAEGGAAFAIDEWSWINHLQLTTPATGPVDAGLLCEVSRPHDRAEGRLGVRCGPTLQMDTDDLQLNLNLALGKHLGAADAERWQLDYQWQVKGLVARGLELGAQGFGALGPWNDWSPASAQEHLAGPAAFLKATAFGRPLRFDAAWLFGAGSGSPKTVVRLRVRQEF